MRRDATLVRRAAALIAALAALAGACTEEDPCGAKSQPCGGDPTGQWMVVNGCRASTFAAPATPTYFGQVATMARQKPPEPVSGDWCSGLVWDALGLQRVTLPYDTLSFATGELTYAADGTYHAALTSRGHGSVDFSAACLSRFGAMPTCEALAMAVGGATSVDPSVTFTDIACADDSAAGCMCKYTVTAVSTPAGTWSAGPGGLLTHFDATSLPPSQADYCADGAAGTLTLWGHHGRASLLEQDGVRRMDLQRLP
jgi:hypothetical protein